MQGGVRGRAASAATATVAVLALAVAGSTSAAPGDPTGGGESRAGSPEPTARIAKHRGDGDRRLEATIRRTTYGVPHIEAPDLTSVAYGFAYAFARTTSARSPTAT